MFLTLNYITFLKLEQVFTLCAGYFSIYTFFNVSEIDLLTLISLFYVENGERISRQFLAFFGAL